MTEAFISFAREFGPALAICGGVAAFLLWWVKQQMERFQTASDKRESYLNRRLDEVQDQRMKDFQAFNERMIEALANNTKAFEMLTRTMEIQDKRLQDWQARPCLYEESKKKSCKQKK